MEIQEAREIVEQLADGKNPVNGTTFPKDSPYQNPRIIRSLFTLLGDVKKNRVTQSIKNREGKRQTNIQQGLPENKGLPWKDTDRKAVGEQFQSGQSVKDLARAFGRTAGGIFAELKRQGLINPDEKFQDVLSS